MTKLIDLHAHTTASDGTLTPSELAREAKKAGLCACAITDHDTVSGVGEFLNECEKQGVEGIPGVELSAKFSGELHIVGLYIDFNNAEFLERIYALEHSREIRNRRMIKLCNELGFEVTEAELTAHKGSDESLDSIGRPHFASVFVDKGYAKSKDEAFQKYLIKGKPCYVARELYKPKETIELVKNAGGIAILAHPIYISRDRKELMSLLTELKEYGLDGAECRYSEYDDEFTELIDGICDELGLIKSGGSDFHGANKPDIALGSVLGDLQVPYEYLKVIKNQRSRLCSTR